MKALTAAEMREVDRLSTERYSTPSLTLMEKAGRSVAEFIRERFAPLEGRRVVVLCGKGNNGGDGFVVARYLQKFGAQPWVYLIGSPGDVKGDARANMNRWKRVSKRFYVDPTDKSGGWAGFPPDSLIVDALLGTGARGAVEGRLREVIAAVNRRDRRTAVVSVDIPSGLHADTGEVQGIAVRADFTVTFTAPKVGMLLGNAASATGKLLVRDIGSPPQLIEEVGKGSLRWLDARELVPFAAPREPSGHKGDYGHALIVAGSLGKSGAAILASWAALRVGSGLVTCATPEPVLPMVAAHTPEIMTEPLSATDSGTISTRALENSRFDEIVKGKRVLAIGPGLSTQPETQQFIRTVVAKRAAPMVLDADGLNAFAGRARELNDSRGNLAITPHPGEMARLAGCSTADVQSNRVKLALKCAADWNVCVVLKGQGTVVASPDGAACVNSTGNPGMGTGGTGDVLTGMLAGMIAQFAHDLDASRLAQIAAFAVYLHGLAGDIAYAGSAEAPLIASDLIRVIPRAYRRFYAESGRA
jgi:ADP-dependent NAD(P)H-hydrate dehydratase / NAD(P)H-hydrate epimerase